jgi:YVTN family beta-propeller protein
VFTPDSRFAYVTAEISGTLSRIDVAKHEVAASGDITPANSKPVGVVTSPDGRRVFVANGGASTLGVFDAATLRQIATVQTGRRPWGIAITPDGSRILTANGVSNNVSVIDARTLRVVATIPVGRGAWGVTIGTRYAPGAKPLGYRKP